MSPRNRPAWSWPPNERFGGRSTTQLYALCSRSSRSAENTSCEQRSSGGSALVSSALTVRPLLRRPCVKISELEPAPVSICKIAGACILPWVHCSARCVQLRFPLPLPFGAFGGGQAPDRHELRGADSNIWHIDECAPDQRRTSSECQRQFCRIALR